MPTAGASKPKISTILWALALLSAIFDDIPFVATMIPRIKSIAADRRRNRRTNGVPFRFVTYTLYGIPMMTVSVAIAHVYVWLRYL